MTIPFDNWGGIDQDAVQRMALDPSTKPLTYRVMFVAIGWANLSGHAEMAPGELARRLMVQTKAGDYVAPSPQSVSNVLADAKNAGLIGHGSSTRCLIAPDWFAKSGGRGGRACKFHGIRGSR